MYKLPMFGCSDPSQVLAEIANATKTFPDAYIRWAVPAQPSRGSGQPTILQAVYAAVLWGQCIDEKIILHLRHQRLHTSHSNRCPSCRRCALHGCCPGRSAPVLATVLSEGLDLVLGHFWGAGQCRLGSGDDGAWLSGVLGVCRLAAFDNVRQVQVAGLLVHRPPSASDFQAPDSRSK